MIEMRDLIIKMKKILLIFSLLVLFSLTFIIAEEIVLRQNDNVNYQFKCFNNDSTLCTSVTQCTISINYPNGTNIYDNSTMTNTGTYINHTLTTDALGKYNAIINCLGSIEGGIAEFPYFVTPNGQKLEISESIIYILLTVSVFIFFILSLYFTIMIPYSNESNDLGMIVRTTKYKYIKLSFFLLSYVLFVWFLNTLIGLSYNFLNLTLFYGFVIPVNNY